MVVFWPLTFSSLLLPQPLHQSLQIIGVHPQYKLFPVASVDRKDVVFVKKNCIALVQFVEPSFIQWIVYDTAQPLPMMATHPNPKVLAPSSRRDILLRQWQQGCRMVVAQNWLGGITVAGRTTTFLNSILVDREPRGVDPKFDKMPATDVLLQDRMRNLEVLGVLGVHLNAVDQLVAVGEVLDLKVFLEVHPVILPDLHRGR
jgi:hypothetical protein